MSRSGILAAVAAVVVLAGGGAALLLANRAKERVVEPVAFAAPDLFPADTVLFASIHDTEADWKDLQELRAKIEPTAAWSLLTERGPASRSLEEVEKSWDGACAELEARLGRKPDAAEFFKVFGGDLSVGFVPLPRGAGLGALLVTRLPDEAELARLREHMGKNQSFRQRQAPPAHGYPVWFEEFEGRTLHYGVGGGRLFLADDQGLLDAAMTTLSVLAAADADTPRPPSLASDPAFRAGVPGDWNQVRMALFLRKGAGLGMKVEQMVPKAEGIGDQVDGILNRTFAAVPGKEAMALSASGPSGSRTWAASWGDFSLMGRAWEQRLPANLCMAWIPRKVEAGVREKAFGADYEALRSRRLWKEIDALVRDGPRLQRLLGEMLGEEGVPPPEVLARIPADVALLGEGGDALLRAMTVGGDSPLCFAQKAYGEKNPRTETLLAIDLDPMTAVGLAALADTAATETAGEHAPVAWLRTKGEGAPTWNLDLSGLFRGMGGADPDSPPDPGQEMTRKMMESWEPGLVLGHGTLYITFGPSMREDVRALCGGKSAPLSADPVFLEAMAAAEPGATEILFLRPSVILRAAVQSVKGPMETAASLGHVDRDGRDVFRAMMAALEEAGNWGAGMRAQVTSTLADPERRAVTVTLLDPAAAAAPPVILLEDAPITGPVSLPAETFLLLAARLDAGPATDALKAAFLRGLEGGQGRWDRMKGDFDPERMEVLHLVDPVLCGVRGEVGFAMCPPLGLEPLAGPPTAGALAARLPSVACWADYRDAATVYGNLSTLLGKIHEGVDRGTFEEDAAAFEAGEGPPAFGVFLEKEEGPAGPSTTLRLVGAWEPGAPYFVYRLSVMRRGDRVWFVASHGKPGEVAGFSGGPPSLEGRLASALPAGAVPAKAMSLLLFREDGVSDVLGALLDFAVPVGPSLTLQGVRGRPSPDRMKAHEEGWREGIDLVKDAMRTGKWQVMGTTREGDRWITVRRRVAGK